MPVAPLEIYLGIQYLDVQQGFSDFISGFPIVFSPPKHFNCKGLSKNAVELRFRNEYPVILCLDVCGDLKERQKAVHRVAQM